MVEMVVDGGMDGAEFLEGVHPSKAPHGALSSAERLVGVLGARSASGPSSGRRHPRLRGRQSQLPCRQTLDRRQGTTGDHLTTCLKSKKQA